MSKLPTLPKLGGMQRPGGLKLPGGAGGRPPLPAMVQPRRNGLDELDPTGDLQADSDAELGAMEKGFRERMAEESSRFDAATSSGEYFVVCFATGEQAGAFLAQLANHISSVRIGTDDLVVDGRDLARWLKFDIPDGRAVGKVQKIDADLKARAR